MELAFRLAHREVGRRRRGELANMGSTLAVLLLGETDAVVAHVGDSRVYRLRDGLLRQLTVDHSLLASIEAAGVTEVRRRDFGHIITRAIGIDGSSEPDVVTVDVEPGDLFLLCTDGLTDELAPSELGRILREVPTAAAGPALVDAALSAGSRDNVTALVVAIPEAPEAPPGSSRISGTSS